MTNDEIERLFRLNFRPMMALAVGLVHNRETARDIVHDVFASLLDENLTMVNSSYLMTGVRFACLKHIRQQSVREHLESLYALDLKNIEDSEWPDEADMERIRIIVRQYLPERTRQVVSLRFSKRMKYSAIAASLGISEVAVYKHLRQAINVLRQKLTEDDR